MKLKSFILDDILPIITTGALVYTNMKKIIPPEHFKSILFACAFLPWLAYYFAGMIPIIFTGKYITSVAWSNIFLFIDFSTCLYFVYLNLNIKMSKKEYSLWLLLTCFWFLLAILDFFSPNGKGFMQESIVMWYIMLAIGLITNIAEIYWYKKIK